MGSDIADQFRAGESFKTNRSGRLAYGYVYEYDRAIIVFGDPSHGFQVGSSEVPQDASRLSRVDILGLPREIGLVFKTAGLVSGN